MKKVMPILFLAILAVAMISIVLVLAQGNGSNGNNETGNGNANNETDNDDNETDDGDDNETEVEDEDGNTIKIKRSERIQNYLQGRYNSTECPSDCRCQGSTIKCELEDGGREMTIIAGSSGNIIVQVKGINVSTQVTLYHHDGRVFANFSNETTGENETQEIVLPDRIKEKIKEKVKARVRNESLELKRNGEYEYNAGKESRFLGLFKIRERIMAQIDAGTGEVRVLRAPWWGFLANDIEDETA